MTSKKKGAELPKIPASRDRKAEKRDRLTVKLSDLEVEKARKR